MSEWWTYTLSDFLMFSPRTYYRLLELYNTAIWPLQFAGVAIGATIVALLLWKRDDRGRIVAALLAACWLWIAWAFHWQRYAQINWAASWFAAAFALQALLLAIFAGRLDVRASTARRRAALALMISAIAGYPLIALAAGRPWTSAETFGMAPDPTAIATLATLAFVGGSRRWLLIVVPLLWCAVAVATLWTMDAPETAVVAGTALLAAVIAARGPENARSGALR